MTRLTWGRITLQGCDAVMHVAAPYKLDVRGAAERRAMVDAAVGGTRAVLAAASACPSVRQVVLTSSTAAVFTDPHERGADHVFTEADWNLLTAPGTGECAPERSVMCHVTPPCPMPPLPPSRRA